MSLRVGIDLMAVEQIAGSVACHGDRFLERVYSSRELADSRRDPSRLAAQFAAKEATMKALGRADEAIGWRSIEVLRDPAGRPSIQLSGAAAELANRRGVTSLAVSLTHERRHAAAVVVAEARR
jgi:holo-[acyl-carrier protein] synthase